MWQGQGEASVLRVLLTQRRSKTPTSFYPLMKARNSHGVAFRATLVLLLTYRFPSVSSVQWVKFKGIITITGIEGRLQQVKPHGCLYPHALDTSECQKSLSEKVAFRAIFH